MNLKFNPLFFYRPSLQAKSLTSVNHFLRGQVQFGFFRMETKNFEPPAEVRRSRAQTLDSSSGFTSLNNRENEDPCLNASNLKIASSSMERHSPFFCEIPEDPCTIPEEDRTYAEVACEFFSNVQDRIVFEIMNIQLPKRSEVIKQFLDTCSYKKELEFLAQARAYQTEFNKREYDLQKRYGILDPAADDGYYRITQIRKNILAEFPIPAVFHDSIKVREFQATLENYYFENIEPYLNTCS